MKIKIIIFGLTTLLILSSFQISAITLSRNILERDAINTTLMKNSESVYILITDSIYNDLENHLNCYIQDLNKEGYEVEIYLIPNNYTYDNHKDIKNILQEGYQNNNLVGSILIGNIPFVKIIEENTFISDIYYMDLDGEFGDENDDGVYDAHTGDIDIEIWIGRLWTQNGGNDIDLLKNYFRKNHAYRTCNLNLPKQALYYETRLDEWHNPDIEQEYLNNLQLIYNNTTFVAPWNGDPSPNDFLDMLQVGYEFVYLHSWSTASSHTFTNGKIDYYEITETDPKVFFYLLSACNVANIENDNYIAGSYIFSESYGLIGIAPTTSSYDNPIWIYSGFVDSLKNGNSFGESYKINMNNKIIDCENICTLYSHLLIGDPTLTITKTYGPPPENTPPSIPIINGPDIGNINEDNYYAISSIDTNLDRISFIVEWGDGKTNTTEILMQSGSICNIIHSWKAKGTYEIKVKAIDEYGAESDWSILEVSMPKSMILNYDLSWTKHLISNEVGSASSLITCDLNNDGNIDFLGTFWDFKQICWWYHDDNKPYIWNMQVIEDDFNGSAYVDVDDVDGDGDQDIIGAAWYDGEIAWWENNGNNPIEWSKNIIRIGYGEAHEVFSCDFENDGDIDIFAASAEFNEITWWRNNGGSSIEWEEQKIGDCYGARSVYVDDLDGDGDNDVLGADFDRGNIYWWRNDGEYPIIWSKFNICTDFRGAHHVSTFDIDNDNDMDVLGASAIGNKISIWINDGGNPVQWNEHVIDDDFRGALKASIADIDDDQDFDIVGTAVNANSISWWRNENKNLSNWTKNIVDFNCLGAWPLDLSDIDGDGDIDVLGGGSRYISWYENDFYCDSNLDCEGNINLVDITPGVTINGSFKVKNVGKEGSILNWEIIEYPSWGVWDFNPREGSGLTPDDGELLVDVTVTVPDEKNTEFSGEIIVSNSDASGDSDIISVMLSTSISKISLEFENYLRYLISFFNLICIEY